MDARFCAGVAPPASSALLSRSFADAAIARALHFSLSGAAPEAPPVFAATDLLGARAAATAALTPEGAGWAGTTARHPPTGSAAAPSPSSSARCRLGPAGGRAGKRRPRPSKRVPTTYISTDAATFRLMVQRVTGADDDEAAHHHDHQQDVVVGAGLGLGLFLPQDAVEPAHGAAYAPPAPPPAAAEQAQQPLFPTLDSWNVMYGRNEVV